MNRIALTLLVSVLTLTACQAKSDKKDKTEENITINNTNMTTVKLTKEIFIEKVANYEANPNEWKFLGDVPCIIDFYADWCGPCKAIAPILDELAAEYGDKLIIYKVDTEKEQDLASDFGIRSIPTLLFVPMEGAPQTVQGALPKAQLKEAIKEVLKVQ